MKVLVLDLGLGNLLSMRRGLERAGAEVEMMPCDAPGGPRQMETVMATSDAIVLPGVGAFGDGIKAMDSFGPLLDRVREGDKALLGVCLGMQLLFMKSY